jgi:hypothetical protein
MEVPSATGLIGEDSHLQMRDCDDLRVLRRAAGMASLRCHAMLKECERLSFVTGLCQERILEAILGAIAAREASCAVLTDYAARHGHELQPCGWPVRCRACELSGTKPSY